MSWRVIEADVTEGLASLPNASVQTVVTSPPYWGLRDYGNESQLGLEPTPEAYVERMVEVFRAVRRVLRDDGTVWLNLGDSYAANAAIAAAPDTKNPKAQAMRVDSRRTGLKPKDLVGIPWRVAFALQADGWYLRSDIIWAKPNPMPESVTDRPTKSHEYVFLLSKSAQYFYDADAVREPHLTADRAGHRESYAPGSASSMLNGVHEAKDGAFVGLPLNDAGRNMRSVWNIATEPFPGAHFATFPKKLVEPCVKAGSREASRRCDCDVVIDTPLGSGSTSDPTLLVGRAGFSRIRRPDEGTRTITRREQRGYAEQMRRSPHRPEMEQVAGPAFAHYIRTDESGARPLPPELLVNWIQRGWLFDPMPCEHPVEAADTVLDPFCGSGTVGLVSLRLGRSFVGIELNPEYAEMSRERIRNDAPLWNHAAEVVAAHTEESG